MRLLHMAVFAAAMVSAVVSHTTAMLKLLVITALLFVFVVVTVRLAAWHPPGRLRLFADGLGWLSDQRSDGEVILLDRAWASRWICMIPCRRLSDGKRRELIVCASDNDRDDYRRLLTVLRSGARPGLPQGIRHG